ncbi:diacylglycerol kinase family lipid kinase [Clostridiaceae bacterium 35-E11]
MKVKFILNPSSGKQIVQQNLDRMIGNLILKGIVKYVDVFTTKTKFDGLQEVEKMKQGEYDLIIAVGGDGTVNEVVNGVMKSQNKTPIAILPAGTVNDFANWMEIPKDAEGFAQMIKNNKKVKVDVGKVNDQYFMNVAAGGLLTNVGYKVSSEFKTVLGRFAYYVEGMKEIPKQMFQSISLEINAGEMKMQEDILMFLVMNSPTVGGFKKIAPKAKTDDGLLDVCIIKKSDLSQIFSLFVQMMKGEHIYHPKVKYIQTSKIELKCFGDERIDLDLDGEQRGMLPAVIEVIPKAIDIITP